MNIINLRNVGSQEIPDSFRGILRISPNTVGEVLIDDPTNLLKQEDIVLSDSEGTDLPVIFSPKVVSSFVIDRESIAELIHIQHKYENLYIVNNLNIRPTLYIKPSNKTSPLVFIDSSGNGLGYPLDAPVDKSYFNYNGDKIINYSNYIASIPPTDKLYSPESEASWLKLNGEIQYHYISHNGKYVKVPILKRRQHVLGVAPTHTANKNTEGWENIVDIENTVKSKYTQLSFLPLEELIYDTMGKNLRGVYREYEGRYFNLNPSGASSENNNSENNLGEALFGTRACEEVFNKNNNKAPILGVPAQSGTIHYSAMPANRYFFHISRAAQLNDGVNGTINNIVRNYILCDGKEINISNYPNVKKDNNIQIKVLDGLIVNTPPLFEIDQLSMRFLRGLNWLRSEDDNGETIYEADEVLDSTGKKEGKSLAFINNTKKYKKYSYKSDTGALTDDTKDKDLLSKNINSVGVYYANTDSDFQKTWKHCHLLFAREKGELKNAKSLQTSSDNKLYPYKNLYQGESFIEYPSAPSETLITWNEYISNWNISFNGSYPLRTKHYNASKELQDCPISVEGGPNSYFFNIIQGIRFGRRRLGKCMNHRTRTQGTMLIKDGNYNLAANTNYTSWRMLSSLQQETRFGTLDADREGDERYNSTPDYSFATFENEKKVNIDDTLYNPPAINLIPLLKI